MSGASLIIDHDGLTEALRATSRLSGWQIADLADAAGVLVENQTKARIADEKAAPDGTDWVPWSESYDDTRDAHHSLLQNENHLLTSTQSYSTAWEAVVGSNLIYAATHQEGDDDRNIPARPYLGLSDANARELRALVVDHMAEVIP